MFPERSGTVDCEPGLAGCTQSQYIRLFYKGAACSSAVQRHHHQPPLTGREVDNVTTQQWNSHLLHHQVPRSHKYKYNHCNPPVITNKMIPRTDLWHGQGVLGNLIKTYNLTFQKYLYLLLLSHKYLFRMIHLFFSGKQLYDKYNFKVSIIFSF